MPASRADRVPSPCWVDVAGEDPPQSQAYSLDLLVDPDPQYFDFTLPGPVVLPDDLPSPAEVDGAGVLETMASTDVYEFAVSGPGRTLTIDPVSCPNDGWRKRLAWAIYTQDTGHLIAEGSCSEQTTPTLDAGAYELHVTPEREVSVAYRLAVSQGGPVVSFTVEPPRASNQRTMTWSFEADQDVDGFECSIDAPSYAGPFTDCSSPETFADLADGEHTVRIRARDTDGHPGPATVHTFTVDTVVPNIQITRKPPEVSNITGPVLAYSADKPGMT